MLVSVLPPMNMEVVLFLKARTLERISVSFEQFGPSGLESIAGNIVVHFCLSGVIEEREVCALPRLESHLDTVLLSWCARVLEENLLVLIHWRGQSVPPLVPRSVTYPTWVLLSGLTGIFLHTIRELVPAVVYYKFFSLFF